MTDPVFSTPSEAHGAAMRDAYRNDGYVSLKNLIPREVANGILARLRADLAREGVDISRLAKTGALLVRPAVELYGYQYPMFIPFLWGLTPTVANLVGEDVLPTYAYFRLYREGDLCKVHGDRLACEHSISLTLGYSDGIAWPLEVAKQRTEVPYARADEDFASEERASGVPMNVGDGVLYQGVHHHHGRTTPNPNRWSAHLFLHWVARNGPYASHAFDGQVPPEAVEF